MTDIKATIEQQSQIARPSAVSGVVVQIARIRWLVNLRWAYSALFLTLYFAFVWRTGQEVVYRYGTWSYVDFVFLALVIAFPAYNVACLWMLRGSQGTGRGQGRLSAITFVQVAIDMAFLLAMIHLTGGWINLLLCLVVFHLAVAASLLPASLAYAQAAWASVLLVGLIGCELWLESFQAPYVFQQFLGYSISAQDFSTGDMSLFRSRCGIVAAGCILIPSILVGMVYFTSAIFRRLRRINQRLVESNRQLAALDLAKSRFLRVSSHHLRSPVAAIHSMVTAMQEVGGFNAQQYKIIQKIQARTENVMAQIDEMMLLSTIKESAVETTQLAPVNVDAAMTASGEAFKDEAVSQGVTLAVDAASGSYVSAWEDGLETVLEHLLSNAVKYTPSGGTVTATAARKGGQVEILVADSGIGIPADQQDRLFHEFFRATNARQVAGGTGMGLAIVKAIVERLGGTIEICSTQDRGTTVRVGLPAMADVPSAAKQTADDKSIYRELQTVLL